MNLQNISKQIRNYYKNGGYSSTREEDLANFINYFDEYMMALVELSRELNLGINMKLVSKYMATRDLLNELEPFEVSQLIKSVKIKKPIDLDFKMVIEDEFEQDEQKEKPRFDNCSCTKGKCNIF